ncbi:MAG: pyridoxamine 5'-phosphate oxidase [Porticoccus sp.]|jgi:pyridoxamine 5'-phosphate oxidase|nr:pyridoxamine 5'-phosphate oxidase [Porticoccus sp.]|tara:strand:+ start:397 stop:1032 length:636 start_codon:yes stop_codon:yes gene_type:complete
MSIEGTRREYQYDSLTKESLKGCPIDQFSYWMDQALNSQLPDPTAMSLATVDPVGKSWQRTVLLKGFNKQGFIFYTNFGSRKALEMEGNPNVSLLFPWFSLDRQVIVGGKVEKISENESLVYFRKRPRASQLGAWASKQSSKLFSRTALEDEYSCIEKKYTNMEVPFPDFWGGYRVVPAEIEFWQGGELRLHDRFQYLLGEKGWIISRLSP